MQALVIGATGATGKDLVYLLLQDEQVQGVTIFVRKSPNWFHEKLRIHVVDFADPSQWSQWVKGDVLFSALGTTLSAAGSNKNQWKVDYDYQFAFAQAAQQNGVSCSVLVSAERAHPEAVFFYSRMKGALEKAIEQLHFQRLLIFRPPLLERKDSDRKGEVGAVKFLSFLNRLGLLRSLKPLPTSNLAHAMLNAYKKDAEHEPKVKIYEKNEVRKLG